MGKIILKGLKMLLKGIWYFFCISFVVGLIKSAFKRENDISQFTTTSITRKQSKIILKELKEFPNGTQLAIGLIDENKTTFFGVKIEDDKPIEIDNKSNVFEVASITKVFTSTLLANAVLDDKIKLSDTINAFYDFSFKNDEQVTFQDLANHTSGLPRLPTNMNPKDRRNPYKDYSSTDFETYFSSLLTLKNKGEMQYSNLGMALLGNTLEKVEKDSYENLLQRKIFSKYQMQNSTSEISKVEGMLVKGFDKNGNETLNWERDFFKGNGAVLSTVEDLTKFLKAQFYTTNKELVLTRKETFNSDVNRSIGLGWHIKINSYGKQYWRNGATGGYRSYMICLLYTSDAADE